MRTYGNFNVNIYTFVLQMYNLRVYESAFYAAVLVMDFILSSYSGDDYALTIGCNVYLSLNTIRNQILSFTK